MSKNAILRDRAAMLASARAFFSSRNVIEVDCPLISAYASVDAHIDLIPADDNRFLHSSPEYGMKRLLADGCGDIFQLAHVFRRGEVSNKHNPEFMMAEWYRIDCTFETMMVETLDFIRAFLGPLPHTIVTFKEAFKKYLDIDVANATDKELLHILKEKGVDAYAGIENEGRDAILNLLLGILIEPQLGDGELTALAYYPATQAALARKATVDGFAVAERFEVYYKGLELANGYHELADADEQRMRLNESNAHRIALGKEPLPIDEHFLEALKKGIPDCCGVAVGFDRLMMLRHNADIGTVIPFAWNIA